MRVISQNGMIDLPYEKLVVSVNMRNQCEVIAWDASNIASDSYLVLATYSSVEKSHRAMEMLRDEWIDYASEGLFQFPADEEVEVGDW